MATKIDPSDEPHWTEILARLLRVPAGYPPAFYRDFLLALIFIPSGIVVIAGGSAGQFGRPLVVVAALLCAGALLLAWSKRILLMALLGFIACRGVAMLVLRQDRRGSLIALAAMGLVWLLIKTMHTDPYDMD